MPPYYALVAEGWQTDEVEERERARMHAAEVSWALRALQRASAEVDRELAHRLGMRPLEYAAMGHLMAAETPIGPVELSARLGISSGSGTELADRLEQKGHVERHRHPEDRRRVMLHAAPAAVGRILEELGPLFTALDRLADDFTPAEQEVIGRYLRAAAERLAGYAAGSADRRV